MSSSIFDLKTNVNELSSANQGTSRLTYDQIVPTRDVTSGNFPNGSIYIKWNVSGEKWWIPSRSYLRMRCELTKGNGDQFTVDDKIAPSMNLMANLFQNMELRINDKTVSRVPNYVSQIEALENRLNKSQAQLNGIMSSTNFMQADFSNRQAQICDDSYLLNTGNQTKVSTSILGLGDNAGNSFIATNTVTYDTGTGIVTFAVGGTPGAILPNVSQVFKSGSQLKFGGAREGIILTILYPIDAISLQCVAGASEADIPINVLGNPDIDISVLSADTEARNLKEFELCWTPCLSLFKLQHAMPAGTYTLVLNPFPASVYQLQAIESRNNINFLTSVANPALKSEADINKVRFNVVDMYFYCNTVDGPRADNLSYLLDLNQTTCQQESIKTASFAQRNYDISPSTYALTVAFQDGRCNNDPRVPSSIFKCFSTTFEPDKELSLERMYISYSGQQRPSPDADPSFSVGVDRTVQRYVDTMIENGSYFDSGGAESIQEFHKRGSYYYFSWARDGTDRSTRASVFSGFSNLLGTAKENANCLLFTHSKQVGKITVQDGLVIDVQVEEA